MNNHDGSQDSGRPSVVNDKAGLLDAGEPNKEIVLTSEKESKWSSKG